jgi:enamine deaminase RidA (YjgF/YER057c/UK114 family)
VSQTSSGVHQRIFDGTDFESKIGYSRAVITGPWVHIAGTTGLDYQSLELPEGVIEQAEQCFRNLSGVLKRADATWADVVMVRYILARRDDFSKCWPIFREYLADVRPAATMYVAELADPKVLFEMEVIAYRDHGSTLAE